MRPPNLPLPRLSAVTLRKLTFQTTSAAAAATTAIAPQPPPNAAVQHHITTLLATHCTTVNHLKQIHTHVIIHGLHQNSFIVTKLIRTLTRLTSAVHGVGYYSAAVFRHVRHPNDFLWTAVIRGHAVNGEVAEAVELYSSMRRRNVSPNSFTFCAVFKGCAMICDLSLGRQFHGQLVKVGGFAFDMFLNAWNALVAMYVKCEVLGCALKVFDEMPVRDKVSWTSLICAYAKAGEVGIARELFDEMGVEKDVIVWTAMITAYAQNAQPKECVALFETMRCCGVKVDEFTLPSVISACAQLGTTQYASSIREIAEMLGNGPETNVVIGSALVDMYSKCGRMDDAFDVFRVMRVRNVYTYSSMILGFAVHGHADVAMALFHNMEMMNIRPNHVTFVGVLTACSHAGMVEEGRRLFGIMEEMYGVIPTADHYTCMIDLLGRSGHLEEALRLANSLTSHPHGGVWGALLGACNIHNNPDIAVIAAERLFEIEPDCIGNYLLLFNILATSGRWDTAIRLQKRMKEKGLKKYPAHSWVEGKNGSVHEFFAGDLTHPRSDEIKHVLDDLLNKLKIHGYQPILGSVSYDMCDDDKREILSAHSEKLALAFELLTTESDHTIRIMKNLRICEDCHLFMCGASKITKREIVVRDNMRFHHFRDGVCSCGNFW